MPYFDPIKSLALRPGGECGEPEEGTGMHLVGGASLPALVAYFARCANLIIWQIGWCPLSLKMLFISHVMFRNVLANPDMVLPIVLSCQGRSYRPPTSVTPDLVKLTFYLCSTGKSMRFPIGDRAAEHCNGLPSSLCQQRTG